MIYFPSSIGATANMLIVGGFVYKKDLIKKTSKERLNGNTVQKTGALDGFLISLPHQLISSKCDAMRICDDDYPIKYCLSYLWTL